MSLKIWNEHAQHQPCTNVSIVLPKTKHGSGSIPLICANVSHGLAELRSKFKGRLEVARTRPGDQGDPATQGKPYLSEQRVDPVDGQHEVGGRALQPPVPAAVAEPADVAAHAADAAVAAPAVDGGLRGRVAIQQTFSKTPRRLSKIGPKRILDREKSLN